MSLTTGRGPLSSNRAGRFIPEVAPGTAYVEPHPRRIQALVGNEVVLDTERALLVHRPDRTLVYAFPVDVVGDLAHDDLHEAPGYVAVPWTAVDGWVEEGRRLVHYPPNPYHRVDCRQVRRRLRVEAAGMVLVDTDDTVLLLETALEPRLYVDPAHVRTDLLVRSDTTSYCNYKGHASYWSTPQVEDVAWSYEDTLPESAPIRRFLSFDTARATVDAELPGLATQ